MDFIIRMSMKGPDARLLNSSKAFQQEGTKQGNLISLLFKSLKTDLRK